MMRSNVSNSKQEAVASSTQTGAAGPIAVNPALPSGSTGMPVYIELSGTVAGYAVINIGTVGQIVVVNNPSGGPTRKAIPAGSFKGPTNSVPVNLTFPAAGTLTVVIGFV